MAASEEAASGEGWNLTVRTGYDGAARIEFLLGANDIGTSIVQVEIDPSDFSKLLDIMVRYPGTCDPNEPGPAASGTEMLGKAIAKHGRRERKARAVLDDGEGEGER